MYIGPWQEYNLSRSRASRVDERLRPGIEQALLSTLDPETAQKAMEAMIPYFDKPNAPSQVRAGSYQNQTYRTSRKRTIHTLPHIPSALSPSTTVISARERNLHASSPLSVRSSQSEPIRYANGPKRPSEDTQKKPKTPDFTDSIYSHYETVLPSIKQVPPHTQPAYNSPAMLNLLRLERNSNNHARSQIAKLTGWKPKETDTDGSTFEKGTADRHLKTTQESNNEAKVDQVNKMKQLYMSGGAETSTNTGKLHFPPISGASSDTTTISKLTTTNLAHHNSSSDVRNPAFKTAHKVSAVSEVKYSETLTDEAPIQTPRVGDVDLDDAAFNLVSKYFQAGNGNSTVSAAVGAGATSYTASAPANRYLESGVINNATDDTYQEDSSMQRSESQKSNVSNLNYADSTISVPVASVPLTPARGVGYEDFGGIDGLLAWSSQLELDIS